MTNRKGENVKKIIFAILCVFVASVAPAYAMDVIFDRDTQVVTINGVAEGNERLAIIITDAAVSGLENATESLMENHSIGFYEVNADEEGKYKLSFKSDSVDGVCNVFAAEKEGTKSKQIILYSATTLESALNKLSDAASSGKASVLEVLNDESFRKTLDIDEIYNSVLDKSTIAEALAKKSIYNSYADVETALLPVTCCMKFNAIVNKVQVKELIKEMQNVYGGDGSIYSKYFGLGNTDTIDSIIYKNKPYTNISVVYNLFVQTVNDYKIPSSGGTGGSGGGGGGGGGFSPSTTTIPKPDSTSSKSPEKEPVEQKPAVQIFKDVAPGFWGYEAIESLYKLGIVSGVSNNEFAPNQSVKREEFVKMLVELIGLDANGATDTFTDTDKNAWYSKYLAVAQECGLAYGKENGSFGVGEVLTRQDMAVLAARVLSSTERGVTTEFADGHEISDYAKSSVEILCGLKVMSGVGDGRFAPKATATRAQAAKVIYEIARLLK